MKKKLKKNMFETVFFFDLWNNLRNNINDNS